MRRNYDTKLSGEIMTRNYQLVYYVAENVRIIGILITGVSKNTLLK